MTPEDPEALADAAPQPLAEGRRGRPETGRLFLRGMAFFARHGAIDAERELGQRFLVDADLWLDTRPAAWADDEALTVSYQHVYDQVRLVMEDDPVNLVETLAERIATRLLDHFDAIDEVRVTVHKPGAPVAGIFADVGVEIVRSR